MTTPAPTQSQEPHRQFNGKAIFGALKEINKDAGDLVEVDRMLQALIQRIESGDFDANPPPAPTQPQELHRQRCNICGADMLHTNPEMCKNFHQQTNTPAPVPDEQLQISDIIEDLERSLKFYKDRVNMLQCWQSSMRDPERKIVCDILANGFTLTTKEEIDTADAAIAKQERDRVLNKEIVALSNQISALRNLEPDFGSENEVEIRVLSRWKLRLQDSLRSNQQEQPASRECPR